MKKTALCLGILALLGSSAHGQGYDMIVHLSSGESVTIALDDIRRIVFPGISTGVEEPEGAPSAFLLFQNRPNPSRPATTIEYEIPGEAEVRVRVFDLRGALVRELLHESQGAGRHRVTWDGMGTGQVPVPSGMYLYSVECGDKTLSRRLLLVK